jgi:hypothetical protein
MNTNGLNVKPKKQGHIAVRITFMLLISCTNMYPAHGHARVNGMISIFH